MHNTIVQLYRESLATMLCVAGWSVCYGLFLYFSYEHQVIDQILYFYIFLLVLR
jgi:hypothetical protein